MTDTSTSVQPMADHRSNSSTTLDSCEFVVLCLVGKRVVVRQHDPSELTRIAEYMPTRKGHVQAQLVLDPSTNQFSLLCSREMPRIFVVEPALQILVQLFYSVQAVLEFIRVSTHRINRVVDRFDVFVGGIFFFFFSLSILTEAPRQKQKTHIEQATSTP